jgi:hypothetical protein
VNTLEVGYQNSSSAVGLVTGTVNVTGTATLNINSILRLARYTGGGTQPVGALNIFGGTVTGDGDIVAGGGVSTIAMNNGTLAVVGSVGVPGAPIGKMALTNAILGFAVTDGQTNVIVTGLTTGGSSNVMNIVSLPTNSAVKQISLIDYSNAISGAGFNFALGSVVPGGGFSAYLSNNVANGSVDLLFISLPETPPSFTSAKTSGTNFIVSGTGGVANWPYFMLCTTNVALPLNQWQPIATNSFDADGNFNFTNSTGANGSPGFYLLKFK